MTNSVEVQMDRILDNASKEVRQAIDQAMRKTTLEAVQKLKNTSPKHSPHVRKYAEGWSYKREGGLSGVPVYTVYNRTNGQLTHLLENGHMVVNAKGTYGRTRGIKHIAPVEEWAQTALPDNFDKEFNP